MKKNNLNMIVSLLFTLTSLLITLTLYNLIPATILVKWSNHLNQPLEIAKFPYIFIIPLISILLVLFLELFAKYDKYDAKRNQEISVYHTLAIFFGISANILQIVLIAIQLGLNLTFNFIFYISIGLLIAFIGNYIPRLRPARINFIRYKLLISHPKIWFKSQRARGYSILISGLLIMLCPLIIEPYAIIIALSILLIALLFNYIYVFLSLKNSR